MENQELFEQAVKIIKAVANIDCDTTECEDCAFGVTASYTKTGKKVNDLCDIFSEASEMVE